MKLVRSAALALALSAAAAAGTSDKDAEEALAAFRKAFAAKDESARVAAIEALARAHHRQVVDALAKPLASDTDLKVRLAAAKTIAGLWCPNAASALVKALPEQGTEKELTHAILAALIETDTDEAAETLSDFLIPTRRPAPPRRRKWQKAADATPPDAQYTSQAISGLKKLQSPKAIEPLIDFIAANETPENGKATKSTESHLKSADKALEAITGSKADGAADWERWWQKNKATKKVIEIHRCDETGKLFEKREGAPCPYDGAANPKCGYFLKTRLEGVVEPEKTSSHKKK